MKVFSGYTIIKKVKLEADRERGQLEEDDNINLFSELAQL
jgi:hypothetical protein